MLGKKLNYLFNFLVVFFAVYDFTNHWHLRLTMCVHFCKCTECPPGGTGDIANYFKLLIVTWEKAKNTKHGWIPYFVPLLPCRMQFGLFSCQPTDARKVTLQLALSWLAVNLFFSVNPKALLTSRVMMGLFQTLFFLFWPGLKKKLGRGKC